MSHPIQSPAISVARVFSPACFNDWLASRPARWLLLLLVLCFSLPAFFATPPSVGLDASWQLSLQLASASGTVFGKEFVFTYGPLGWLLIHFPVTKLGLLLYDFFILFSLLSIYRKLLPERPRLFDALLVVALALVTKGGLSAGPTGVQNGPAAILFAVLCYWLWMIYDQGSALAVVGSLVSAMLLFFSKVNYAMILVFMIPAFGIGLLFLCKHRRIAGLVVLAGFPLLVGLGASLWHVDLPGYLHSARELIAGYNETMSLPTGKTYVAFELACLFLLAMGCVAISGRARLPWTAQAVILPLMAMAALLLFKNSFVRFDKPHYEVFHRAFPLLLAIWCVAWRSQPGVKALLLASLVYPLALKTAETPYFGRSVISQILPIQYFREVAGAPWRETSSHLQQQLCTNFPAMVFPDQVLAVIGRSSVDVMPFESSLAVLNGLNLRQRPIPQSYCAFSPWLDALNASFVSSHAAADFLLYTSKTIDQNTIDNRPAAWDESLTKMALLENYTFQSEFNLPLPNWVGRLEPAQIFLLKKTPGASRFVAVLTNEVNLTLGQPLNLPLTTNQLFLTLRVERTLLAKLSEALLSPAPLSVTFQYQDGSSQKYFSALPILQTGVLVNRRVESPGEIRNWLQLEADHDLAVSSISFTSSSPWAFKTELKGVLVEYRVKNSPAPQ